MSTRYYPLYRRGNPQLRIYLPNFWMKLLNPASTKVRPPPNCVTFEVSPAMTKLDVKNYLEKIYKVPVMNVNTTIVSGRTYHRQTGKKDDEVLKDDDRKLAFVTLRSGETFEFPDVVKKEQLEEKEVKADDDVERTKREFEKNTKIKQVGRKGLPTFFGL